LVAVVLLSAFAVTGCSRTATHETSNWNTTEYNVTQTAGTGTFERTTAQSFEGEWSARAGFTPSANNAHGRGVFYVDQPANAEGYYAASFYFPAGTFSDPQSNRRVDILRWDNIRSFGNSAADFGGIQIYGSDHKARLFRQQSTSGAIDQLGASFTLEQGCWNTVVVRQKASATQGQAINEVFVNGDRVVNTDAPNAYGRKVDDIRVGLVDVRESAEASPFQFYVDNTYIGTSDSPPVSLIENPKRCVHETGIWYDTAWTHKGNYVWIDGHGYGTDKQFLADVNGDDKDDAVAFRNGTTGEVGNWYVALSTGGSFAPYTLWATGHGFGSTSQMMGDVNGDEKADAVVFFNGTSGQVGDWYVALSTGNGFLNYQHWATGHGFGSTNQLLGDVDGDGRADAIAFFDSGGRWYVALAREGYFLGYQLWSEGHGQGTTHRFLADVDGDSRDDAVVANNGNGNWYVALAREGHFLGYQWWLSGWPTDADGLMLGDVVDASNPTAAGGDGKADVVTYYRTKFITTGRRDHWLYAPSTGAGFGAMVEWKTSHGPTGRDPSGVRALLGNVDGTSPSRDAPVVFTQEEWIAGTDRHIGRWRYLPAAGALGQPESIGPERPEVFNLWDAYNIYDRPLVNGVPQRYDSSDPAVIDEHLRMIRDAGIDFIVLDLTNGVGQQGWIANRAYKVCERVAALRAQDRSIPKLAVAVGQMQFSGNPATLEQDAQQLAWENFAHHSRCGPLANGIASGYQTLPDSDGVERPVLVSYAERPQRTAWEGYGDHTATDQFTLRWAQGSVTSSNTPDPDQYWGWTFPQGSVDPPTNPSVPGPRSMVVMPGWNRKDDWPCRSDFISRNGGATYTENGWDRVEDSPDVELVVINSFNHYQESTAVAPTDTSGLAGCNSAGQQWSNPYQYWSSTIWYNQRRKGW
jgi:hypothetical protein